MEPWIYLLVTISLMILFSVLAYIFLVHPMMKQAKLHRLNTQKTISDIQEKMKSAGRTKPA